MILRIGALLLAGLALAAAAPLDDLPLSPAQILLFDTPHLKAIDHPASLECNFELAPLLRTPLRGRGGRYHLLGRAVADT